MESFETWESTLLLSIELLATLAFALSGIMEAARKRMDVVGVCVVGFLAAFGGGTLRDILLDQRPFFWVENEIVMWAVLALCILSMSGRFWDFCICCRFQRVLALLALVGVGAFLQI